MFFAPFTSWSQKNCDCPEFLPLQQQARQSTDNQRKDAELQLHISMFFLGIFFGNFNSGKPNLGSTNLIENNIEQFASVFYFILGILLIYPYFKLFQFGKNGKIALENNNQNALEICLNGMSSFFKFSAYITIIVFFIFIVFGMFI